MRLIRENNIEKHLVHEARKIGGIAYKFVSPGRRGVPDRLVALPNGNIIFVECKAPGESPLHTSYANTHGFCPRPSGHYSGQSGSKQHFTHYRLKTI